MVVARLSALHTSNLYPQEVFLVLLPDRDMVDPRDIVRSEGLSHCKISVDSSEPATFLYLNHKLTIAVKPEP